MRCNIALKGRIIENSTSSANFAAKVGLREARLSRIIWRRATPTAEEIEKICAALDCAPVAVGLGDNQNEHS